MHKTRLLFSKTGRAKYISHLDLMRTMRRAFLRAGIELRYSEGFNPHPYMSVALPLSVGCESVCEIMDFEPLRQAPRGLPEKLNSALPEGIMILESYAPVRKPSDIAWCEVRGRLFFDSAMKPGTADILAESFENAQNIIIQKKTKRGVAELDVKPHITGAGFYESDTNEIVISARLSAQQPVLSPVDFLNAISGFLEHEPDLALFRRIELYDMGHNVFR